MPRLQDAEQKANRKDGRPEGSAAREAGTGAGGECGVDAQCKGLLGRRRAGFVGRWLDTGTKNYFIRFVGRWLDTCTNRAGATV